MAEGDPQNLDQPSVGYHVAQAVTQELAARGLPTDPGRIMGLSFNRETLNDFLLRIVARLAVVGRVYAYDNSLASKGLQMKMSTLVEKITNATR